MFYSAIRETRKIYATILLSFIRCCNLNRLVYFFIPSLSTDYGNNRFLPGKYIVCCASGVLNKSLSLSMRAVDGDAGMPALITALLA
jgi:hypothetical protein